MMGIENGTKRDEDDRKFYRYGTVCTLCNGANGGNGQLFFLDIGAIPKEQADHLNEGIWLKVGDKTTVTSNNTSGNHKVEAKVTLSTHTIHVRPL